MNNSEQGEESAQVLVQVVLADEGQEIGYGSNVAERLGDRADDIHRAITVGARTVAGSLTRLPPTEGWRLDEVSASFGVTLTTESGVILATASAGATFEVTLSYKREGDR